MTIYITTKADNGKFIHSKKFIPWLFIAQTVGLLILAAVVGYNLHS